MDLHLSLSLEARKYKIRTGLAAGSFNSELSGTLRAISLQEGRCPEYQALSYTWGDASAGQKIRLNGEFVSPLPDNPFNALQRLRHRFARPTIWVDATCINQVPDEERGYQVAFMDRIISNATCVSVWLGEPNPKDVDGAGLGSRRAAVVGSALQTAESCWNERAWVVQEFVHVRKRYICAGDTMFEYKPGKFFRLAAKSFPGRSHIDKDAHGYDRLEALRQKLDRMRILGGYKANGGPHDKPDILRYLTTFRQTSTYATDPRDMVYSILSLITDKEARIIGVDYSLSTRQVYAKATYASFAARKNFDLLIMKNLQVDEDLLSWALEFSAPPVSITPPRTLDLRRRGIPTHIAQIELDADLLALRVRGRCFDITRDVMDLRTIG